MFFTFQRFLGHFTNHTGQKLGRSSRKSTKNGVGRHHFRDLFGPIWTPTWAHMGPNWPIWSHHYGPLWYWRKKLSEMLKSAFFRKTKNRLKNLYSRFSKLFFLRGRLLLVFYLYNFQPIWIISFAFSSQSDGATIWRLELLIQKKMAAIWFWKIFVKIDIFDMHTFRRCHFGLRQKSNIPIVK